MWHPESRRHYASATGFSHIEDVSLSLSTQSTWHLKGKRQLASSIGFNRIRHATLSLSSGFMLNPERNRIRFCRWLHLPQACSALSEHRVHVAPRTKTVIRFCNWLHPHRVQPLFLCTGSMWHPERKRQCPAASGFTHIERVPHSPSTGSMWNPERKRQYASRTGFTRIEEAPLSLSNGFMWHPERKRQHASASGFTRIERAPLSLNTVTRWHAERKRQYTSAGGFTATSACCSFLALGLCSTRNV
ncbi:hypothetical protein MRX96_017407 [Rhipicephalus microplus]